MPVACVTGGGRRVGAAISRALGRAGYDVVVHAQRSLDQAAGVVADLERLGRRSWVEAADLEDAEQVSALAERVRTQHDRLDLLVNSAAAYERCDFDQIDLAALRRMLRIDFEAPFLLIQGLLAPLRAAQGAVVNITDTALDRNYTPTHHFSHYAAAKAALSQLTRSLALELAPDVRVNAVAPGPVAISADTTTEQRQELLRHLPAGREGSPDDVADAVVYLAGARYVTGQTVRVDGGLSIS